MSPAYLFDARVVQDHFPGIGRYAYNLLAALPACLRDDESLVVLHDPSARNTRFNLAALDGPRLRRVAHGAPIFSLGNALRAPRAGPASAAHYPYYVRPYLARTPSVTTLYDAISFVYPQLVPSTRARLMIRVLTGLAVRASRRILTISESAARDIARFYPATRSKITVTPLAAESSFTPQPPDRQAAIRARYGLPDRFALYLASNKPHKNLVRLMDAWEVVVNEWGLEIGDWRLEIGDSPIPNLQSPIPNPQSLISNPQSPILVIAGHQDPRFPQARQRARDLGIDERVRFIGEVGNDDMPALYSACDLFVFPSLHEGFGLTPLEAMACGAPVACSNASSLPEVAGDAALLFDPADAGQIAAACARVLGDPALRADLRRRSLRQAARFSWRATAEATLAVYRELAGK
jgi:alpha-1,3-rhamnosyl/mannosyltransferase